MTERSILLWQLILLTGQLLLLALNAWLVWMYVVSTRRIEQAAAEQAEGLSKPAIVLHEVGVKLKLLNIGSGAAIGVEWWFWPEGADNLPWQGAPAGRAGFIEKNQERELGYAPAFLKNPAQKVICRYRSISGRVYRSELFLRHDLMVGDWYDATFHDEG